MAMDRREATKVLREILSECDGSLLMSNVSITPISPSRAEESFFELKINCELDDYLRKCIYNVLEKHKLTMNELEKSFVIFHSRS